MNENQLVEELPQQVVEKKMIEINDENPFILLACYGTLRQGRGNWETILSGNRSEYLGTFKTEPNYTMYGKNAGFPIVVDDGTTPIEYDVFKVTNNAVLRRVHSLEGCTGIPDNDRNWYDIKEINTPVGKGYMYVQYQHGNPNTIIETGNWNTRNH